MNNESNLHIEDEDDEIFNGCLIGSGTISPIGGDLYVDTDDSGEIPHFHIRNFRFGTGNYYGFLTGIEFQKPAYFHQQRPTDVLDDEERQALSEFFSTVVEDRRRFREAGITVWDMACIMWNWNNPDNPLPDDLEIPDYTKLGEGL